MTAMKESQKIGRVSVLKISDEKEALLKDLQSISSPQAK